MNQHMLQHEFTTGRHLWLCIVVAVGLALGTQVAVAKECHRETPLPADVRLSAPGPEVPEAVARFAGVWSGARVDEGREALCHTLVVEEVLANGYARIIFSHSTYAGWDIRQPHSMRATGRIVEGELRFQLPVPERPKLAYRFVGEALQGSYNDEVRVSLTQVADLSQVGCGPQADSLPPAPSATGPRDRLTAAELLAAAAASTGPVHNAYFMPVGQAAPALNAFTGTLTLGAMPLSTARHGCAGLGETLSGFTVAFFTHGEHLVPVVSDIVRPRALIVSPGWVWSESGDGGMSRASFPFVVTEDLVSRNGLATFLYDDTRVSGLQVQVVQKNDPVWRRKYDIWGQTPLTYTPGPMAHEDAVRARFAAALQQQTPIQPWSAVPVASEAPGLAGFDGDTAPDDLKASGVIIVGVEGLTSENLYG